MEDVRTNNLPIYLYRDVVCDIAKSVDELAPAKLGLITSIVNPNFDRDATSDKHIRFTRSELLMDPYKWEGAVIAKLSDPKDCDSSDDKIRLRAEAKLKQEMDFAQHLISRGRILIKLHGTKTSNLGRLVDSELTECAMLVEVPMIDPKQQFHNYVNDKSTEYQPEDTWQWWNRFRLVTDFNPRITVALELSADLPSQTELLRWYGEPVKIVIIPVDIFVMNKNNFPVLGLAHKNVVLKFLAYTDCRFAIKAPNDNQCVDNHVQYLRHLYRENSRVPDMMVGYDDVLEIPLQPLYDNLNSYTYEVFEKDPIKYIFYQRAIEGALSDKISDAEAETKTAIVMVVGAGRGPLVRSTINAAVNMKRKVKIYVVEKNPNAIVTLTALKEEMWSDKDLTIISTDMRELELPEKVDILVSELLGSFGDNELSPECLDGAQKHLKPDGISIPSQSTSYINPLMAPKLLNSLRESVHYRANSHSTRQHLNRSQAESPHVVYIKNAFHITEPKPVFVFDHPNRDAVIDNNRYKKLEFNAEVDCVLTGFAAYFDTVLYKDIKLSIHPLTHTQGMVSWFSMYFPLEVPQQIRAGEKITVDFWRRTAPSKVWYEWCTSTPTLSHIHNINGRAYAIYK